MATKTYQLTYLAKPELNQEDLRQLASRIQALFEAEKMTRFNQAKAARRLILGKPIKKGAEASLINISFQALPDQLANLQKGLKKIPSLLRFIILTQKPEKQGKSLPSIQKQKALPGQGIPKEPATSSVQKPQKVDWEEIEKKLDEILGQN